MANVAFGCVSIKSEDGGLLQRLKKIVEPHAAFSFDGAPTCSIDGNGLNISFSGPWNCRAAWGVLDVLLADKSFPLRQSLLDAEITGHDEEPCAELFTWLRKLPGEVEITYSEPLVANNINSVWDAFKLLVPHLPKVRASTDFGTLENLKVSSKRAKMTVAHGSCLHYSLSFDQDGIAYKFSFYITSDGVVIGTKYWSDCMENDEDDEDLDFIENESDYIYAIVREHMVRTT